MSAAKRSSKFPPDEFYYQFRMQTILSRSIIFYTSTGTFTSMIFQIQIILSEIFSFSGFTANSFTPQLQFMGNNFQNFNCLGCLGLGSQVRLIILDQIFNLSLLRTLGMSDPWLLALLIGMSADWRTAELMRRVSLTRFWESWATGLLISSVIFQTAVIQDHLSWWSCADIQKKVFADSTRNTCGRSYWFLQKDLMVVTS